MERSGIERGPVGNPAEAVRKEESSAALSGTGRPQARKTEAGKANQAQSRSLEAAKKDMGRMLDYIDKLNELDTAQAEPMSHIFSMNNVFREDVVTNGDDRDRILQNAPEQKEGAFKVPRTVE